MTTARVDPVLGLVYPVVITFGDQPPQEIGVVQANRGAEQALVDLVALLHDAADVMLIGGDQAIAAARARYVELQPVQPGPRVVELGLGMDVVARPPFEVHHGPALADPGERKIHAGHVDDCAICNPDRLAAHHYDEGRGAGGARLVEHMAGGVTCCAHHVPLSQSCQACGR
jgi:hypothetical protein